METSTKYQTHTSIMKELNLHSDYHKARENSKEDFETIYTEAIEADVKLSNVKEFLSDLTEQELNTLQNYSQLVETINVDEISDEGAYNLLMHYYEKYDFDNDGFTEDGNAKTISLIPQNIDNDLKEALVSAVNNSDQDSTFSLLALTLDIDLVKYDLAQHIDNLSKEKREYLKENSSLDVDVFVESQLQEPYQAQEVTYDSIMKQLDYMLNLELNETADSSLKRDLLAFSKLLENNYQDVKESKIEDIKNKLLLNDLITKYQDTELTPQDPLATLLQA